MADRISFANAAGNAAYSGQAHHPGWFGWNFAPAAMQAFGRQLAREEDRWFAWAVVAFGAGIAAYFALDTEPPFAAIMISAATAVACLAVRRYISAVPVSFLLLLAAWSALGLADAELRTRIVAAPTISRDSGPIRVTGRVEDVEMRAPDSARVVLAVSSLEARERRPAFVRLTVSGARGIAAVKPGAVVSALVMLRPPPHKWSNYL